MWRERSASRRRPSFVPPASVARAAARAAEPAGRPGYFACVTIPKMALCGSRQLAIHLPPGTSMGPWITVPPPCLTRREHKEPPCLAAVGRDGGGQIAKPSRFDAGGGDPEVSQPPVVANQAAA